FYEVLYPDISFFRVFKYITTRAFCASLCSLFFVLIFTPIFINYLKKRGICERVKEEYLENHIHKSTIPTMGGIIILFAIITSTLLFSRLDNRLIILILLVTIGFGLLGFLDDSLKTRKRPLKIREKLSGEIGIAILISIYLFLYPLSPSSTNIAFPFTKGFFINLGIFYILFCILVIVSSSNAVNLTDGLDGLAIGSCIFVCLGLIVMGYLAGHIKLAAYLKISYVPQAGELVVYLASLLGASLGFLWFNSHPATIFMGDTGSLTLGGVMGTTALVIKQEIPLIILGGLFVLEAGSTLIQIISFRITGKKIFLMAPLHHHFEKKGWYESKIVIRFWIIAIIFVLLSFVTLKIR
ncbi:MAG: phospho-N-acetylmuramoyl-pentapeptide-transferase, partial [bacterium]